MSGVSMPANMFTNDAACISLSISGCFAMLSVASQANASGIAASLLPFDQMRQQIAGCLAVADEVVVDEIDRLRM